MVNIPAKLNSINSNTLLKNALQWRFSIFEAFFSITNIEFTNNIKTAGVSFDKNGNHIKLSINEDFWKELTLIQQEFIVCHETLHIIYNHGIRGKNLTPNIANIAMDMVINEELVRNHGFNRSQVDPSNQYVWHDKYFQNEKFEFKSFEYYYEKLLEIIPPEESKGGDEKSSIASHEGLSEIPSSAIEEIIESASRIEKNNPENTKDVDLKEKLSEDEINASIEAIGSSAGEGTSSICFTVEIPKPSKNRKFYKYINDLTLKAWKSKNEYTWIDKPRRIYTIPSDFFIPNEREISAREKDKAKVAVFMDTSGSCVSFSQYFWKIASTIPLDKFDVDLYCFDTRIYSTTLASKKMYGFGGTSFCIISDYINSRYQKHPDLVFVITDGYGDNIQPKDPKKWIWLMTNNSTRMYIPKESRIDNLKDFDL